ncbi:LAME_0F03268g1_1 [Lachancea meyersii CBS 8951]|uniref:Exocyst complex component Sec8 n=1 Tax=Lachancea meyersii CBS 8951 TaxID=1266667 RepID=A0A1G4JRC5_9SACH|nr:LAME_0F03268g1_1 [Lachancea meyersii CBS 8951]
MSSLSVPAQRRRALSVNNATHLEKEAMNNALDSLQNDLTLISTQWNKVITAEANPLELALAFLDDTSVGLGHRHKEFKHLSSRLGNDLQRAVNEHYQAFNTNIASYEQIVEFISESQELIGTTKDNIVGPIASLGDSQAQLEELNESSQRLNQMLEVLDAVELILALPDSVEELIKQKCYLQAKEALVRGFSEASQHNIWEIPALHTTKQMLESQKHTLFETLIEDINDLLYSKRLNISPRYEVKPTQLKDGVYNNMENFLTSSIDLDIEEQATTVNEELEAFLDKLKNSFASPSKSFAPLNSQGSVYEKVFMILSILNDMDELHPALISIAGRAKEEIHNIIAQATDAMRVKHPSLIKFSVSLESESVFELPGQEVISLFLQNVFWEIFLKLLLTLQGHRVVYEVSRALQPSSVVGERYRLNDIWNKLLDEVNQLLLSYTIDPKIQGMPKNKLSKMQSTHHQNDLKKPLTFSIQNNLDDKSSTRNHANDLRDLLKEMFPGFSATTNLELKSIYLEEEAFELDETLVPARVFNMAFILESLLLFVQGSSSVLPSNIDGTEAPMTFFSRFMDTKYLPQLELTLTYLFKTNIETLNPYAIESQPDSQPVFKAALDFKDLFHHVLCLLNVFHGYKAKLVSVVLKLLDRFCAYYQRVSAKLLGASENPMLDKKINSIWTENAKLRELTSQVFYANATRVKEESSELLKACPKFYQKGKNLKKQDIFNSLTVDTVASFLRTLSDVNEWLLQLRKVSTAVGVQETGAELQANTLRNEWSLFGVSSGENAINYRGLKLTLDDSAAKRYDNALDKLKAVEYKLWASLRYDIRARCIYYVTRFLQDSSWCPESAGVDLDVNITALTAELTTIESRLEELLTPRQKELVFEGLSEILNSILIESAHGMLALNHNGVKKMTKNINILQHICRSVVSSPENVNMKPALEFFALCGATESIVVQRANAGELQDFSFDDIKNILRLQLSEELQRQTRRESGMARAPSISANKRLSDAVGRLHLTRRTE